jgi:hypothetical protein
MPFLLVANPGARSSDALARRASNRLDDVRAVELHEGLDLGGEIAHTTAETVDIELAVGSHPIALDGEPDERTATIHIQIDPRASACSCPPETAPFR